MPGGSNPPPKNKPYPTKTSGLMDSIYCTFCRGLIRSQDSSYLGPDTHYTEPGKTNPPVPAMQQQQQPLLHRSHSQMHHHTHFWYKLDLLQDNEWLIPIWTCLSGAVALMVALPYIKWASKVPLFMTTDPWPHLFTKYHPPLYCLLPWSSTLNNTPSQGPAWVTGHWHVAG